MKHKINLVWPNDRDFSHTELISCYHKEPSHLATCTRTVGESTPALNTDSSTNYNYQSSAQGNAEITLRCTLNRKRTERCSPFPSPQKLTQSPARKQRKDPHLAQEQNYQHILHLLNPCRYRTTTSLTPAVKRYQQIKLFQISCQMKRKQQH